ncbi:MAG: protease inhibitor I42 family protein [Alphaproteobacteria bacterium]
MTEYTAAIRRATLAAARLHRDLGIQAQATRGNGRVDVFEVAVRLNVPLVLKPLEGLLGAYLTDPAPGVLVTTKRPLSVQRFTAAHELGHHRLGHTPSLDDESILRRTPFAARPSYNLQEVEADAFAAFFLLPRWLVAWHCQRQGWNDAALHRPETVYQLALRAGTSYLATCWTLFRYRVFTQSIARHLAEVEPKTIKQTLLAPIHPDSFYGDVWLLTERDAGLRIEGGPSDLFVMRLHEHSGAGYLWRINTLDPDGFAVVDDARENDEPEEAIGGPLTRRITAQSLRTQTGEICLVECQPWQPNPALNTFKLPYDLTGAESEGLSRAERRHRLEAA